MWASPFEVYLMNLRQLLPPHSIYYWTREEAYQQLKEWSGQDFGYDAEAWEKWGRQHRQFYPSASDVEGGDADSGPSTTGPEVPDNA